LDSQSSPLRAQFSQIIAPQRVHSDIVLASPVRRQWPHSIMDMLSTPSKVYSDRKPGQKCAAATFCHVH
jgi:hypothetical protein